MEIKLNTKTILEKEFKSGLRGYNQEEVDLFLDDVIQDYQTFTKKIETLEQELNQLKKQAETVSRRPAPTNTGNTNFDILKRISNLEKHVFGDRLSD